MANYDQKMQRYGQYPFLGRVSDALALTEPPTLIRAHINLIYDCGDHIVRLTPNAFRSPEEVHRELHWMAFVTQHMKEVARLRPFDNSLTIQLTFENEVFTVARFDKIHGRHVVENDWTPTLFKHLGRMTGQLHHISQQYAPDPQHDLLSWDEIPEAFLHESLPNDEAGLLDVRDKTLSHIAQLPKPPHRSGAIHYDIHAGNFMLTNDALVLFDFENSCRAHYAHDIAVVLYYALLKGASIGVQHPREWYLAPFEEGYKQYGEIDAAEKNALPWFLLYRGLMVYSYLYKIWPGERTAAQRLYTSRVAQGLRNICEELKLTETLSKTKLLSWS